MTILRMALRNVSRQKKRSILLGGAIAFGVMIITLVQSFTGGIVDTANARVTELLGGHIYVSGQEVTESGRLVSVIREQEPLDEALSLIESDVDTMHFRSSAFGEIIFVSNSATLSVDGVEWGNEPALIDSLDLVAGNIESTADESTLIIPEPLAEELGAQIGESVLLRVTSITGQQNVGEFTVGGLIRDSGFMQMDTAYADKAYLNSLIGMTADQYQTVVVSVTDTQAIDQIGDVVDGYLADQGKTATEIDVFGDSSDEMGPAGDGPPGGMMGGMAGLMGLNIDEAERWEGTQYSVSTINDVMEPVMTLVNILNQVSLGLFVVLLAITMVGLLNTFRMILIERTREIGTIRSVGMQRHQVRNLFLTEAVILALGGALGGLVISGIVGLIVSNIPINTETPLVMFLDGGTFTFPIDPMSILGTLVILTIITLLAAYLPARRAALMHPADALRTSY